MKVISKPLDKKCPWCNSKNLHIYYDFTTKDVILYFCSLFLIKRTTRHYQCMDCAGIWID